ncbi:MAG: universal stress protein [Muribaculum sp.]|nr:universal stress protein [Muribaculaceae bacterium]MCM1080343.1 universal stress protein [Muribaculum sp.]
MESQHTDQSKTQSDSRLITLAIHTYGRALVLKNILEQEGVVVTLQNVNLTEPEVSAGVRVRIQLNDLPLALRVIENPDIYVPTFEPEVAVNNTHKGERPIIVPIDFSPHSIKACDIAFQLADRRKTSVILLNSFISPAYSVGRQLGSTLNFDVDNSEQNVALVLDAKKRIDSLSREIRQKMRRGDLPEVNFSTSIIEGIPEEVIGETAKQLSPELIVMGTRAADKKERELIGSVTAEVLDSSRFPILTIPEHVNMIDAGDIHHVVLFCGLDQDDIIAVDALYRFFNHEQLNVELVWFPAKKVFRGRTTENAPQILRHYCEKHYSRFKFQTKEFNMPSVVDDFAAVEKEARIDLIAIPNKKKSMFSRLFNPSLAHRLLFHADIPMMAIPV